MVEGEEADRDRDTTRGRAEKEEPDRARDNQDWRNAGKRKGEKQKRPPPPSPQHLPPSTLSPRRESCARCKEQGAGPGVALLPKEPSAPLSPPSCCVLPTHTPSFPCLVGTEGGGRPYAQVRRILQKTLLKVLVDVVVGLESLDRSPSEVCAQLGCNDAGPAVHPKSASASQFVRPPTQRPNGRD